MIKKISAGILCIIFAFSVCVFAAEENTADRTQQYDDMSHIRSSGEGQMPRRGGPGGMRGQRPGDIQGSMQDGMQGGEQNGERPQMPPGGMRDAAERGNREIPSDAAFNSAGEFRREEPAEFEKVHTEEKEESSNMGIIGFIKEYKTAVISLVILAAAFVFVIFYRRKVF